MAKTTIWTAALAALALTRGVLATDVLKTSGFTNCEQDSSIQVNNVNIEYSKTAETVTFDVSGTSSEKQKVMALLNVTAYGIQVYSNKFDPCAEDTFVDQLCPGKSVQNSPSCLSQANNSKSRLAISPPKVLKTFPQNGPAKSHP